MDVKKLFETIVVALFAFLYAIVRFLFKLIWILLYPLKQLVSFLYIPFGLPGKTWSDEDDWIGKIDYKKLKNKK